MVSADYVKFVSDIKQIFTNYEKTKAELSENLSEVAYDDHESRAEIDYLSYENYQNLVGFLMTYLESTLVDSRFKKTISN